MFAIIALLLLSLALIAGPIVSNIFGHDLGPVVTSFMMGGGFILFVAVGILAIFAKLYVKTKASEAFVRTGSKGLVVIKDGGALVIPLLHNIVRVSLETIRLEVLRELKDSLLTKDKLRADIRAEFFVRIMPTDEAIKNASRSFANGVTTTSVKTLVEDKLISALRTVAATMTLEELNSQRDNFLREVTASVKEALDHNGLTLETATISKLDQTNPENLNENNVFDAQGLRTIAEITQAQRTVRNEVERNGEQARKEQDVKTRQQVLELERQQAEAEAAQKAEIAKIQAEKDRDAQEKQIAAAKAVELATVAKTQALEVAERQKQSATEVAEREKQQAITMAEQKVEVAKRAAEQAVAVAEAERAKAVALQASAEAEAEKERQNVTTVQVTATAEREKQQKVIQAQAEADSSYVTAQRSADAKAYSVQKDAEARKAAADADAEAVTKKATADAVAATKRAEGATAEAMVPVTVKQAEVAVEQKRVDVLRQELEAREKHGQVAQQFEVAKLEIEKRAEVQIAAANAAATLYGTIKANVYGTPEDVSKMAGQFMRGMGVATMAEGFLAGSGDELGVMGQQVMGALKAIGQKVGIAPETLAAGDTVMEVTPPPSAAKPDASGNGKSAG